MNIIHSILKNQKIGFKMFFLLAITKKFKYVIVCNSKTILKSIRLDKKLISMNRKSFKDNKKFLICNKSTNLYLMINSSCKMKTLIKQMKMIIK